MSEGSAGADFPATGSSSSRRSAPSPRAWAELLRLPALFTVPGDALAGAATAGARATPRTLLAIGSSLCLYEAGMALNDWADRHEDAVERPHRPLPSGRVRPTSAFAAAGALTAAGLALAARAGRPALAIAVPLTVTVWSYDLALKHTPAGPLAMAAARALDLLLGATATTGTTRAALPAALTLGAHTLAVTTVSRHETRGGSSLAPLTGLAMTAALAWRLTRAPATDHPTPDPTASPANPTGAVLGSLSDPVRSGADLLREALRRSRRSAHPEALPGTLLEALAEAASARQPSSSRHALRLDPGGPPATLYTALAATYAATTVRPFFHAVLNPSPPLTQRAVGSGIRAVIPLQAALTARAGAPVTALLTAALAPAARRFARKVNVT